MLHSVSPCTMAMEIRRGSLHCCRYSHVNENTRSCLKLDRLPSDYAHPLTTSHDFHLGRLMSNEPLPSALAISRTQINHHFLISPCPPLESRACRNCLHNRPLSFFLFLTPAGWTNRNKNLMPYTGEGNIFMHTYIFSKNLSSDG